MKLRYGIGDIAPYINWDYFFHAWGMTGKPAAEREQLRSEAEKALQRYQDSYHTYALFELYDANSDGDDIVLNPQQADRQQRIPLLRQQHPGSDYLCLADFVRPQSTGQTDCIGVFATSVDIGMESDFDNDPYDKMMMQLLADRLAEATAERMHQEIRCRYWGYAPEEDLTMEQLHSEQFQGIRPAVGYPSLPDTSINFVIDRLIGMSQIGIRLTESGAMKPHASVSGLMIAHPRAHYFAVGKIGSDQLADYAHRRGLPLAVIQKFLCANL